MNEYRKKTNIIRRGIFHFDFILENFFAVEIVKICEMGVMTYHRTD